VSPADGARPAVKAGRAARVKRAAKPQRKRLASSSEILSTTLKGTSLDELGQRKSITLHSAREALFLARDFLGKDAGPTDPRLATLASLVAKLEKAAPTRTKFSREAGEMVVYKVQYPPGKKSGQLVLPVSVLAKAGMVLTQVAVFFDGDEIRVRRVEP